MFITHKREKLINSIIYFVKNTNRCHKLKLFKLLSFLDFEHYRQTGRSVTGLRYDAWPMGPVPSELDDELKDPPPDLRSALKIFRTQDSRKFERTIDDYADDSGLFEYRQTDSMSVPMFQVTGKAMTRFEFRPTKPFDPKYFTKREIRILETLAEFFRDALSDDMRDVSHMKGLPWAQVYGKGEGKGRSISYGLALSSKPIIRGMPTIEREELDYREEALREVRQFTRG